MTKVDDRMASVEHNEVVETRTRAVVRVTEIVGGLADQADLPECALEDLQGSRLEPPESLGPG
jgi:hypothetical protein